MTGKDLRKILLVGLTLASFLCALCWPSWSQTLSPPRQGRADQEALNFALDGQEHYRNQQFRDAALAWQEAAETYESIGDMEGAQKSLINQSQALQDLGQYPKACRALLQAFDADTLDCSSNNISDLVSHLSEQSSDLSSFQGIGLRSLGDVLRRQGLFAESKQVLQLSSAIAQDTPEAYATYLSLGNTERALGKKSRNGWEYERITDVINRQSPEIALQPDQSALTAYQQAAAASAPAITQLQANVNQLSFWLDLYGWWDLQTQKRIQSGQRLSEVKFLERANNFSSQLQAQMMTQANALQDTIEAEFTQLPPSRASLFAQLNFAKSLIRLNTISGNELVLEDGRSTDRILPWLEAARSQARDFGDPQGEAYAIGYMGQLYETLGQFEQATQLTRQALRLTHNAQPLNLDASISYPWQAQLGRLLEAQGDRQGAINAYTEAYHSLQSLRADLNASNRDIQFDFQQEVKPVYLALADLLLKSTEGSQTLASLPNLQSDAFPVMSKSDTEINRLEKARQVIESLQIAELDNFFQDPCSEVPAIPVQIDDLDRNAAVIYPIVFRDRLDLILSLPNQPLRQTSVPVSQRQVEDILDQLYDLLNNESIDTSAINIFRTVPLDPQEVQDNLQQLLPIFSQIYDWLVQPVEPQLRDSEIKTLVFVLNDRLQRIPMAALYDGQQYLAEKYGIALAPSLQLINPEAQPQKQPRVLAAGVSQQTQIDGQTFPALVNVPKELNQIQQIFPKSKQLLNRGFTEQSLRQSLTRPYSIVHLATHGLFSSISEQTFIVTGENQKISIDDLSRLLKGQRTRSPGLLVLSACDTATGDEQAVLGLAGVAVRAGTSSTLATLWPVSDASTTLFMEQFYQALNQPEMGKAEALNMAQKSLLKRLKDNPPSVDIGLPPHPYSWAPYVLVGNWL